MRVEEAVPAGTVLLNVEIPSTLYATTPSLLAACVDEAREVGHLSSGHFTPAWREDIQWEPLWEDGDDSWGAHVVQHNAFVVDEADTRLLGVASDGSQKADQDQQPLLALCVPASLANHSCRPGCTWRIERAADGRVTFVAWTQRSLPPGTSVTIPYWSPLASRWKASECADQFDFECSCEEVCDLLDRPVRGLDPCIPRVSVDKLGVSFRRLMDRHGVQRGVAAPADDGLLEDLMRLIHRYAVVEAVLGDAWPASVATPPCAVSSSLPCPTQSRATRRTSCGTRQQRTPHTLRDRRGHSRGPSVTAWGDPEAHGSHSWAASDSLAARSHRTVIAVPGGSAVPGRTRGPSVADPAYSAASRLRDPAAC